MNTYQYDTNLYRITTKNITWISTLSHRSYIPSIKMAGSINISSSTLSVLVMAVTLYQSLFIDAFIQHQHTTTLQIKRRYLASSKDDIDIPLDTTTTTTITSTPSNPFLPLLSKGLHQTSIAMNKYI